MSVFSVPVTIGIDEEKIKKEIENDVKSQVITKISEEIINTMYKTQYPTYRSEYNEPLRNMIESKIGEFIKENEDTIVKEAAKLLAERMARTKIVKEAIKEVVDK